MPLAPLVRRGSDTFSTQAKRILTWTGGRNTDRFAGGRLQRIRLREDRFINAKASQSQLPAYLQSSHTSQPLEIRSSGRPLVQSRKMPVAVFIRTMAGMQKRQLAAFSMEVTREPETVRKRRICGYGLLG